ncbi:MAG: glycosyltransferase family 87 protein [Kiritimatiellia bacterium]
MQLENINRLAARKRIVWHAALMAVLLAGLAVRMIGIHHGAPRYIWHPDVSKQVQMAIEAYSKTPNPREYFNDDVRLALYPYGSSILLAKAMQIRSLLGGRAAVEKKDRWLWDYRLRWQASLLFLFAVATAALCLRPRLGPWTLLLGGLALVLEPASSLDSHYGMNDVPMAALVLMAWALCTRIPQESIRIPWPSLCAGLALGLAFGVKYTAALAGIFPLAAWIGLTREKKWKAALISVAAVGIAGLAGMWITCPMLRNDPSYFLQNFSAFMQWQANVTGQPVPLSEKIPANLSVLIRTIIGHGHFLLILGGLLGTVLIWRDRDRDHLRWLSAALWILAAVLIFIILTGRDIARANDLLMLWPPMIMIAASGLSIAPGIRRFALAATLLTIGWFGAASFLDAAALSRPDTRERARDWCIQNIPAGSVVISERYTLPVEIPGITEKGARYLYRQKDVSAGGADFLISSSMAYGRFFNPGMPFYDTEIQSFYLSLTNRYEAAAEFHDRELPFAHPRITVYRKRGELVQDPSRGEVQE